jgi:inorganic triphosphatase YgiF
MPEEERKYDVDRSFVLPDLFGPGVNVVPRPPKRLTATYFDTEDLRLTRAGASLRFRRGDDEPWTVKLATDVPGVRQEISRPGQFGRPPEELTWLVASITRGAELKPLVVVRSRRRRWELHDDTGRVLAEIDDDNVSVLDGPRVVGRFREIEVELRDGPRKILTTVEE